MGLISSEGKNLLDFLVLWQVLLPYDGDLRDSLWWPQEGQSPCELLGGFSGLLSRLCRGVRSCVEPVPEPEDSSPLLTWILGTSGVSPGESVFFSSGGLPCAFLSSGDGYVGELLELQQGCEGPFGSSRG